jgi:hypothetical protein
MKPSVLKTVGMYLVTVIGVVATSADSATDSLVTTMEVYFSTLKKDFNQRATSSIVKTRRVSQLRRYFAQIMKKNPSVASLMKVNARGMVMYERVRNQNHPVKKRSVAKRQWFLKTAKGLKEYDFLIKDKKGRANLLWSIPLLREGRGSRSFDGAVVAVIDLKNCFHTIAKRGAQPFLVRLNNKNFYEHSWKDKIIFVENHLNVPGVENIIVRYQKSDVSVVQQAELPQKSRAENLTAPSMGSIATHASDSSRVKPMLSSLFSGKKNMPVIVSLIILIVVVAVLLIIQITDRINRRRAAQSSDKWDRF